VLNVRRNKMPGPSELDKFSQNERKTKALERIADALDGDGDEEFSAEEERGLALAGMKAHLETIVATLPKDEKSFPGVLFSVLVGGYDMSIERSDEDGGSIDRLPIRNRREALQVIECLLWAVEQEESS
jgi:hypothetical protein